MREIVLDTETTGLDPVNGDRIVEVGCVELVNHIPSGRTWHEYFNPERAMPRDAFNVHGLSDEFLRDKPRFADLADGFLEFVADARIIIHNASFDCGFLDAELTRCTRSCIRRDLVIDTLALARRKHPGAPNSLDALCKRYGIDNSARTRHGALLDAELLAEVYLELIGGRQARLTLVHEEARTATPAAPAPGKARPRPQALPRRLEQADMAAHADAVATLGDNAIWRRYETD